MRHLSVFRTTLNGRRPLLLSARVKDDNELFGADLTNPDILIGDQRVVLMRDIVHLFRARFLWQSPLARAIRLCNYGRTVLPLTLAFEIDADFADIFEVRGATRTRRGSRLESQHDSREPACAIRDSTARRTHYRRMDRCAGCDGGRGRHPGFPALRLRAGAGDAGAPLTRDPL